MMTFEKVYEELELDVDESEDAEKIRRLLERAEVEDLSDLVYEVVMSAREQRDAFYLVSYLNRRARRMGLLYRFQVPLGWHEAAKQILEREVDY